MVLLEVAGRAASVSSSAPNASMDASSVEVVRSRVVKVCTTGDYPPLTSYDPITKYTGLAPTVLRQFGRAYNYSIEFVHTTWSTLEDDLEGGSKCIMAAGGISETQRRSARFGVSVPLLSNAKVPIFSKVNEALFKSLADVDQAGVTVLENKGGTNEAFAEALRAKGMLSEAKVHIVPDNGETWACMARYPKLPLVFFTDTIEAEFRASTKPTVYSDAGLSFAMPVDVDFSNHKVFLTSTSADGMALLSDVNHFLMGARGSGLFEAWRREAFSAKYSLVAECPWEMNLV